MGSGRPEPGQLWVPARLTITRRRLVVAVNSLGGAYYLDPAKGAKAGLNYATKASWESWARRHAATLDRHPEPRDG